MKMCKILQESTKIKWNPSNKLYYQSKGYLYTKWNDEFEVNIDDLYYNSNIMIKCTCDYCGRETFERFCLIKKGSKICCNNDICIKIKRHEIQTKREITNMKKYGCKSTLMCDNVKEKAKQTSLNKYGVENAGASKSSREKAKLTMIKKYGFEYAIQSDVIKQKRELNNIKKYGYKHTLQLEEVKQKTKQTNLNKYGVEHLMQIKEIKDDRIKKSKQTMYKNGTGPCSKQQQYIHNIIGGELNYPVDNCLLDIAFPNEMIYIEYDGGGHGWYNKREFSENYVKQLDIKRQKFLQNLDWKIIRIISKNDKLPNYNNLIDSIKNAKEYLLTTNHTWVEIDIDNNKYKCSQYEYELIND